MRFLHTADWHLGRMLNGERLTEDQAALLDQIVAITKDEKPDAVVVAGDIYDRAVPPPESVALLDETLARLILGCKTPVILIAGNHDSPDRLGFGSRLLAAQGLHVAGTLNAQIAQVDLPDAHGMVEFHSLPYAEPPVVKMTLGEENLDGHDAAMRAMLSRMETAKPGTRRVLIAHAFVAGGEACESERPLSIGGAGTVNASCFSEFAYVALGHLHRPQRITERVHYSGSLMKYSFSEANDRKSIQIVEMDARGACGIKTIPLTPKRDLRRIQGMLAELLRDPGPGADDYLEVTLLDEGAILDALEQLRKVYPKTLSIKRAERPGRAVARGGGGDHRQLSDRELFNQFYEQMTEEEMTPAQTAALIATLERLQLREREASA